MRPFAADPPYVALPTDGSDVEDRDREKKKSPAVLAVTAGKGHLIAVISVSGLTLLGLWATLIAAVIHINRTPAVPQCLVRDHTTNAVCIEPVVRREWRTLSIPERADYLDAVKCLASRPSRLHRNASLYDDFPWVHKELSAETHVSAPFLPWHRLYIHIYEQALKEECGMQGHLPYWDWSQDWEAPEKAPIWDHATGVGGDGNLTGLETVGNGRCVTDGPFAGLQVKYFDGAFQPHCLSRGFASTNELRELGKLVDPRAMSDLMRAASYKDFEEELERRAHHFLSKSVRGDLSRFTGPNDPIFFLHHTNIDRLWWQWQMTDPAQRMYAFEGQANNITEDVASLTQMMDMAGLGRSAPVVKLMETQSGLFCYSY